MGVPQLQRNKQNKKKNPKKGKSVSVLTFNSDTVTRLQIFGGEEGLTNFTAENV